MTKTHKIIIKSLLCRSHPGSTGSHVSLDLWFVVIHYPSLLFFSTTTFLVIVEWVEGSEPSLVSLMKGKDGV